MPPPPTGNPPARRKATGTGAVAASKPGTARRPAAQPRGGAKLVCTAGPASGQEFSLEGDEVVIGMGMFLGKARCLFCHKGPTFSDGKFHNIGIPGSGTLDPGVAGITQNASDSGKFKTPTLRNIALTAPYFHDGSRATLADAVRQYEVFDADFPNLDPRLSRTSLSRELLAFLETLTSPKIEP